MSPQKSQSDFYSAFRFPLSNYRLQHPMPCLVSVLDTFLHPLNPPPYPGSSSAGIPSEGLAGAGVPTVVNTNPALNRSSCLKTPDRHVLTMFLSCCLFSRDCGAAGKRKSGEAAFTLNTFIPELKSSEVPFIKKALKRPTGTLQGASRGVFFRPERPFVGRKAPVSKALAKCDLAVRGRPHVHEKRNPC